MAVGIREWLLHKTHHLRPGAPEHSKMDLKPHGSLHESRTGSGLPEVALHPLDVVPSGVKDCWANGKTFRL